MKAIAEGDDLFRYIPQRPPFVLVGQLYYAIGKKITSGFMVSSDCMLVKNGYLQESGLVENMAQTAALLAGYQARAGGQDVPLGYIASLKNLKVNRLPVVKEQIFTDVEIVNEVINIQVAKARIYDNSANTVASCEMRIYIKQEDS